MLEGAEYQSARKSADAANAAIHRANPNISPAQIHEIKPVKFGGSPTNPSNKITLSRQVHEAVTAWWRKLQRDISGR